MKDNRLPKNTSDTGATINLVTKVKRLKTVDTLYENCLPEPDPYQDKDCGPNYQCSPDEEEQGEKMAGASAEVEDECPDYGCCPEKAEQECEPNV